MPVNDALASDIWYRFRYCVERGHYQFLEKADKCDNFTFGNQWTNEDKQALKESRRPALTINKIISTMSTIMGEQIYNRNEVSYRPAGEGATSDVADALCKVWAQIAHDNQLSWTRSDVFATGIIRSRGFYDVRMAFGDNMKGKVVISLLNSKNVVVDPDAEEYDPDSWNDVFTTKWLTYQDIALLYNQADAEYLKDKEESLFPYAYDSIEKVRDRFAGAQLSGSYYGISDKEHVRRNIRVLERQCNVLASQKHFVDVQTGDTRPIPDGWDRDRIASVMQKFNGQINVVPKKIKRRRWTVTADHVILHDDWSPYRHLTVVPYFPHFHYGRTSGLVEHLIDSQELLNKSSSQELHVVNTTANSGWKVKANNLVNMEIEDLEASGAKTGLVVEVKEMDGLEKITPNTTPQGMDRISYKAEEHMKTISGVSDSMQGFDREDVAAKAIAYKKQSGKGNLVKVLDNLERTDFLLARNVLHLVQDFYTDERLVHIIHNDMENEAETITVNQYDPVTDEIINDLTSGEYSVVVSSAPDTGTVEDAQFQHAKELKEMGLAIPDDVLIENSRLQRRSEVIKQMKAASNSPEALKERELKMRGMEANVAKVENEAQEKTGKYQLDIAKAQKEGAPDTTIEKMQAELQLERERMDMEMQKVRAEMDMKWQEMQQKLAMKQEEHQQDMAAKQQEAEQQSQIRDTDAYARRAAMLKSPSSKPEGESNGPA